MKILAFVAKTAEADLSAYLFFGSISCSVEHCESGWTHDALIEAAELPASVEPGWLEKLNEEEEA